MSRRRWIRAKRGITAAEALVVSGLAMVVLVRVMPKIYRGFAGAYNEYAQSLSFGYDPASAESKITTTSTSKTRTDSKLVLNATVPGPDGKPIEGGKYDVMEVVTTIDEESSRREGYDKQGPLPKKLPGL